MNYRLTSKDVKFMKKIGLNGDDISEVEENVNKRLDDVSNSYDRYKATGSPARTEKLRDKIRQKMNYIKSNYVPDNGQAGINFLTEQAAHLKNMGAEKEFQEVMGMIDKEEKKI